MSGRRSKNRDTLAAVRGAALALAVLPSFGRAAINLVGPRITISGSGVFWPAAAYNPASNQYLVLWVNVSDPTGWQLKGRRIDADTGALLGSEFHISPDPANIGAIIGAVTYNAVNHEWFVAYQANFNGGQDDVLGQRIASNGTKIGGYIPLVVKSNYQNSADVAHDPVNNRYLVVWNEQVSSVRQMFCRLFDSSGAPLGSELRLSEVDDRQKFNPRAAYNPVAQEYMVIWLDYRNWPGSGQDNNYGDIYGQRVNPAMGAKIGANIPVYAPLGPPYAPNGQDTPNGIACNTQDGRYAIGITKLTAADGWTTVGLVVNSNGSQVAPVFNLSRPNFGAQATPAYNPVSNTYFISYEATTSNVGGKEISAAGAPVAGEEAVINNFGAIRDNVLAIRPSDGQFLQVAVSDGAVLAAQRFTTTPDVTPPAPISNLAAARGVRSISLTWTNPVAPDFTGTMIRSSTAGYPGTPADGDLVVDEPGTPGAADSYTHRDLTSGVTYYYAAFAHDGAPNHATAVTVSAVPFHLGDFDQDDDVDLTDFARLQLCFSGSAQSYPPACEPQDLDEDLDVDAGDVNLFSGCLAGADLTPGC